MAILRTDIVSGIGGRNTIDGSLFFDGSGRLSVPNSEDVRVGSNDFTIEAWIRAENPGDWTTVLGMWDSSAGRRTYALQRKKSDSKLYFYVSADGGSTISATATQYAYGGNVTLGDWHHVAGVRDGNTIRAYLNGVEVGNASFTASILNNTTDALFIGDTEVTAGGEAFNGHMSNVRMIKGTCLYPSGTTFTPPTQKLTAIDGTVLLCCQDSDDPTQEATGKTITGYGNLATVGVNENLVTNGNFTRGTTGWDDSLAPSSTTLTSENQRLKIVASGGTGRARQEVTGLTIGNRYKFQVRHVTCASGNCFTHLGTSSGGAEYIANLGIGDEDLHTFYFTATATSAWIQIGITIGLTGYFDDVSITLAEQPKAHKVFPPVGKDTGTVFEGDITFDSLNYMTLPKGTTTQSNRGRGVFISAVGSGNWSNAISYIQIQSMGNAQDFGDLIYPRRYAAGTSSTTRGVIGAGIGPSWPGNKTTEYSTLATTGNTTSFGELLDEKYGHAAFSNSTRGIFTGGYSPSPVSGNVNVMEYITFATTSNALDFGDQTDGSSFATRYIGSGISNGTRGTIQGGYTGSAYVNTIVYVPNIASLSDTSDFGNLSGLRAGVSGCSDTTRGIFFGGYVNPGNLNTIEYITIASTGDATDFGDLTGGAGYSAAVSNSIRGVTQIGNGNTINYVTIQTTGNAQDFGDLNTAGGTYGANANFSDSHGGLT